MVIALPLQQICTSKFSSIFVCDISYLTLMGPPRSSMIQLPTFQLTAGWPVEGKQLRMKQNGPNYIIPVFYWVENANKRSIHFSKKKFIRKKSYFSAVGNACCGDSFSYTSYTCYSQTKSCVLKWLSVNVKLWSPKKREDDRQMTDTTQYW